MDFNDKLLKGFSSTVLAKAKISSRQNRKSLLESLLSESILENPEFDRRKIIDILVENQKCELIDFTKDVLLDEITAEKVKYSELEKRKCIPLVLNERKVLAFCEFAIESAESIQYIKSIVGYKTSLAVLTLDVYEKLSASFIRPRIVESIAAKDLTGRAEIEDEVRLDSENSSIESIIYRTIKSALGARASDIHFLPIKGKINTYFRIDGVKTLFSSIEMPIDKLSRKIIADAKMPEASIDEVRIGKLTVRDSEDKQVELRVNIIPSKAGPDINLRILSDSAVNIDMLGMSSKVREDFDRALKMTKGLVLIVGPMGSGKSTTLYSGLKMLKEKGKDICAIEDPVEIKLEGITQVDVSKRLSYKQGVESFMRHNANVLMIGEIREIETANAAFTASSTGALTLSTLHSNSALSAVYRLINMGVTTDQITESLAAIIAQRLVRKVCPDCGKTYEIPEKHNWREEFSLGDGQIFLNKGEGCVSCAYTGFRGRVVIQESIFMSSDVRECIDQARGRTALETLVSKKTMRTMWDDAKYKAMTGQTTFDEISPLYYDIV